MINETRVKYAGSTPGADSNTYAIFSSVTAFPLACAMQAAGMKRVVVVFAHSNTGTINVYRSADRGTTWAQVSTRIIVGPSATGSSCFDVNVSMFSDFKLEWVNGGSAQTTWTVDIALTDEQTLYGLEGDVLALAPYSFIESDGYAVDGATGKVAHFYDKVHPGTGVRAIAATHKVVQATGSKQVPIPSALAAFKNRPVAAFASAGASVYISDAAASAWQFLHDGTGGDVYAVWSANGVVTTEYMHGTWGGGLGHGWQLARVAAALYPLVYSTGVAINTNNASTIVAGTGHVLRANYSESQSPELLARVALGATGTGNTTLPPTASASVVSMCVGRNGTSSYYNGKFAALLIFNRILSAAEDVTVREYFKSKYGVS